MESFRLNKYLSAAGICSRREADKLIMDGHVFVNGFLAVNGMKVSDIDEIYVDGKAVKKLCDVTDVLLAFYKPKGIVCSNNGQGSVTINDYLKLPFRIFSVGRLDKESEGLLILTNQGDLANSISKARYYHEKEYVVKIDREVNDDFVRKMSSGVRILDTVTRPCKVWKTGKDTFHIVLTQGLNRQIRRMCEVFGSQVVSLKRIRIMNIELGELKPGDYRKITGDEKCELFRLAEFERRF